MFDATETLFRDLGLELDPRLGAALARRGALPAHAGIDADRTDALGVVAGFETHGEALDDGLIAREQLVAGDGKSLDFMTLS